MHPDLTRQLIDFHHSELQQEAREHRLTRAASIAARRPATPTSAFMPHVQEGGRVRRAIAALLRPMPA